MPLKLIKGWIGGSDESPSLAVNNQKTINFLLEVDRSTPKTPVALFGVPGLKLLGNVGGGGAVKAFVNIDGDTYAAIGQNFGKLNPDWSFTVLGTFNGTGRVKMESNGLQVALVDGLSGFTYTVDSMAWTQITAPGFVYGSTQLTFQDGFFISLQPDSGRFSISGLYDGQTWTDIDFASAEGLPDNGVAIISSHRILHILGENSLELWVNQGAEDFPFVRIDGSFFAVGCSAQYSVCIADDSVFWLGNNDQGGLGVYRMEGTSPKRISTPSLEKEFRSYGDISNAYAFGLDIRKHPCWIVTFPSVGRTWCFDAHSGLWSEWLEFRDGNYEQYRVNAIVYAHNQIVVGDYRDGRIYSMSFDHLDNAGDVIRSVRQGPSIWDQNRRVFHSLFELHIEPGVGTDGGPDQGFDPKVVLRYSDDNGMNFGPELARSMGKIGQSETRVQWRRLGSARSRIYEIVITDPVKRVIYGASLDAHTGAAQ